MSSLEVPKWDEGSDESAKHDEHEAITADKLHKASLKDNNYDTSLFSETAVEPERNVSITARYDNNTTRSGSVSAAGSLSEPGIVNSQGNENSDKLNSLHVDDDPSTKHENLDSLQQNSKDGSSFAQAPPPLLNVDVFAEIMSKAVSDDHAKTVLANDFRFHELLAHQSTLLESLENENNKFTSVDCFEKMEELAGRCKLYHFKLGKIKKAMQEISSRTTTLKKTCQKLQVLREKADIAAEERKRKELEREKLLMAKPAPK